MWVRPGDGPGSPPHVMQGLPPTIEALIFDFDGTLAAGRYDFRGMRERVHALAAEFGVGDGALDGLHVLEAVERAAQVIGDPVRARDFRDRAEQIMLEIEFAGAREARLLPGVPESLQALRDAGVRVAIVTRNSRQAIALIPGAQDLACDVFLPREAVARVKPHPDHLRAALAAVGRQAEQAAMVGDHPMDMAAGKAAGTLSIGVLTGSGTREALLEAGADLVAESVGDVATALVSARTSADA